jgi:hypothetical protein
MAINFASPGRRAREVQNALVGSDQSEPVVFGAAQAPASKSTILCGD